MTDRSARAQMLNEFDKGTRVATRFEEDGLLCLAVDGAQLLGSQEHSRQGIGLS